MRVGVGSVCVPVSPDDSACETVLFKPSAELRVISSRHTGAKLFTSVTDNCSDYDAAVDDSNHMQNCARPYVYSCTAATLELAPGGQQTTVYVKRDVDISNGGLHFRLGRGLIYTPEEFVYPISAR